MDVIFRREGPAVDEYWFPGNGNYWLSSDWPDCLIWSAYATRESVENGKRYVHVQCAVSDGILSFNIKGFGVTCR